MSETPKKNGQRNGFKHRTIRTSTGQITLVVPKVRNSETPIHPFIPVLESGSRVDRALNLAIAEMYLHGVSTRKVAKVLQDICVGNGVSASYISKCTAELDTLFEQWRNANTLLYLTCTLTQPIQKSGSMAL